jgi:general secretion pathway protein B
MSLILEALKKSEAERQRREVPGLMTQTLKARPRRRWRWMAALALLVLALGGGWWLGQRGSEGAQPVASVPQPPIETAAEAPALAEAPPATAPAAIDRSVATRRQPTPARPADPVAAPPPERESAPMVAPASPDPLLDPEVDAGTRARLAEVLQSLPEPSRDAQEDRLVLRQPAVPSPAERDAAAAPAASSGPPQMHELPFALRRDIPELRVSMVVSSADADARFALVNGERRREGDELADGVRLVEIRPQTLELEFRGQRFLLRQGSL